MVSGRRRRRRRRRRISGNSWCNSGRIGKELEEEEEK